MGPGEHRPHDYEYWTPPWSTTLFAGDLFEAIPFGDQPTMIYAGEEEPVAGKHFIGAVAFGYGMLITPTCDMTDQQGGGSAHPYRVLVPVLPLRIVIRADRCRRREREAAPQPRLDPSVHVPPPLGGVLEEESVACLFRPSLVSDELLADPPRRIAQLQPAARRHLKVKLAAYWARVAVDPTELPLTERDEDAVRASTSPPSRYDALLP
jgi:hypothetical protein